MSASDLIALFAAIIVLGGTLWAVCSWTLDKKFEKDKEIEQLKKLNVDNSVEQIAMILDEMKKRMTDLEVFQNNNVTASMKQFHSLELTMKDYQRDVGVLSEQTKQQRTDLEKLWKTVVTEIAPGVFRVSDKK